VDSLRGRRVLVTGATGFIGRHVVRALHAMDADVHALTRWDGDAVDAGIAPATCHRGDLTDPKSIVEIVTRVVPEHVVHLGAFTHVGRSWEYASECIQTNVQGTVDLLLALREVECRRVLYVSSSDVYGDIPAPFAEDDAVNPLSPYAVSKYSAERFCVLDYRVNGTPIVIVRPFSVYGPGQSSDRVVPEIILCALRGTELRMTDARQTREFNHVDDIASGIVAALTAPGIEGEILNLGCGEELSIREVTGLILDLMGNPITARFGAIPPRPNEVPRMAADSMKARRLLGWQPQRQLRQGLAATIDWYRAHGATEPE
jgi:UDP-glucose 4-epimerase